MSFDLIIGPMFAGKTTTVCTDIARYKRARKVAIMIKYAEDERYKHLNKSGGMITHDLKEYDAVPVQAVMRLSEVVLPIDCAAIGIDEVQFYPDAPEIIDIWARAGIHVKAAGLDADFQRKPFLRMPELMATADKVTKLQAVCAECGADASFTKRLSNETTLKVIGADDKYAAVCRKCHSL